MPQHRQIIKQKYRWLSPLHGQGTVVATSQAATAGRVGLSLFEVATTVTIDQIVIVNGATAAGNVIVGIYGPITTEETPDGVALLVQSADTVQTGINTPQAISIASTTLRPGRYYVAAEYSSATGTFMRHNTQVQVTGWIAQYDRGGGYGALSDPCPATTVAGATALMVSKLRCVV